MKGFLIDKRNQVIALLIILFLIKIPQGGIRFTFWILAGVFIAAGCDLIIKRVFLKEQLIPKSAVISGFITAGILDYHQPWFVLIVFSLLAIVSKNVIKYKGRHLFNPANFGLFFAALFGVPLTWNIESNILIIVTFGIYMAYSIRKLPHVLGFVIFFSVLSFTQGINPLMLISWFFVFVMLIEPKTSGFGKWRGFTFGSIAAITAFLVFRFIPAYDFLVAGLFIANLFNPILERIKG